MIAIAAAQFFRLQAIDLTIFKQLFILLGLDVLFIICFLYPLLLYLFGAKMNPFKWIYATIGPFITAIVTGDTLVSVNTLVKQGKEHLGIRRMVGSSVFPLFAVFGKAGTALVACTSFILIMKSYSSLEIPWIQIASIVGYSMLISFSLGSIPGSGILIAVSLLCGYFDLKEGYLILNPAAPILVSIGVLLDIATNSFVAALIARREQLDDEVPVKDFV